MGPTLSSYDNDDSKSMREFNRGANNQDKDYITLISGALDLTERS